MKKYLSEAIFLISAWVIATTGFSFIVLVMLRYFQEATLIGEQISEKTVAWYMTSPYQILEGFLFGLCFGIVHFIVHWFTESGNIQKLSFGRVIWIKSLLYLVGLGIVTLVVYFVITAMPYFPKTAMDELIEKQPPMMMLFASFLFMMFFLILFNFLLEINKKFGPNNLLRIFLGRYHTPIVEERIFMFLDLKSSTYYAEKLGHFKYSQLIQLCFRHLNLVLEKSNGEIYQYVGDEAVMTWDARYQENFNHCIDFFFAFRSKIEAERSNYESKFGLVPEFKAGVNCGSVTAAEVGTIKREIAYHGDVLNTAARIQEQCNGLKEKLLISGDFLSELGNGHTYHSIPLGATELKGKYQPVKIFAIKEHLAKEKVVV